MIFLQILLMRKEMATLILYIFAGSLLRLLQCIL